MIDNRISTSWYHRQVYLLRALYNIQESNDGVPVVSVKKRPHPQNLENLRKIQLCEERLERFEPFNSPLICRLKKEQGAWPRILKSITDKVQETTPPSDNIDITLVRPIEAAFLRTLDAQHTDMATAERDIKSTTESGELEFQIDRLYQSLHTVSAFAEMADKYSTRVLEEAERVLADRENRAEKAAGTDGWNVQRLLRQVTRV